jgi:hypothetical protein
MTQRFAQLVPAHQAFVAKYMNGHCDALAIALSTYFEYSIVALRPVHVKADGRRQVDPDFLHVYVVDQGDLAWDARGLRPQAQVLADFEPFLQVLRREDDVTMEVDSTTYNDAREFVFEAGSDPSRAGPALDEAIVPLGLCQAMAVSTRSILADEETFDPDCQDRRHGLFL